MSDKEYIEECDHCDQEATREYFGNKCCDDCYDEFLEQEWQD